MSRSLAEDYYLRVRPALGQDFFQKRVFVWDLGRSYLPAEALARTGLRRQEWFDQGAADGAFCRSLGWGYQGQERTTALALHCRQHDTIHQDWDQLVARDADPAVLRRRLRQAPSGSGVDLLLCGSPQAAPDLMACALDHRVPLVLWGLPARAGAQCLALVWTPDSPATPDELLRTAAALSRIPCVDPDALPHHLQGLEGASLALSLARWVLTRRSRPRPDLEERVIGQGRSLVLRGHPAWPWWVRLERPSVAALAPYRSAGGRYAPPLALVRQNRLLVLGLGTGSLFCAEAGAFFPSLLLVDGKQVSPVNPVRQAFGTNTLGAPKASALRQILQERWAPAEAWQKQCRHPFEGWRAGDLFLGSADFQLQDSDASLRRLDELLDAYQPTLAVVAMGRTKDDNFLATQKLRQRGIAHITPSAFPGVTHFKHIVTDGAKGPCYDCLQGHLPVDGGAGPQLHQEEREMFYGGSQPATLAETLPSAHSLLRLARDLAVPAGARPAYLARELAAERNCFVGANRVELRDGQWLYGVDQPCAMVTYGVQDMVVNQLRTHCSCGRPLHAPTP